MLSRNNRIIPKPFRCCLTYFLTETFRKGFLFQEIVSGYKKKYLWRWLKPFSLKTDWASLMQSLHSVQNWPSFKKSLIKCQILQWNVTGYCKGGRIPTRTLGRSKLTVSLSMRSTFMPGPLSSIILETYCFTAKTTFMVASWQVSPTALPAPFSSG